MKNAIIPLLLIGMLFSVTFGVAMMNHMEDQSHSPCPFEAAGVTDCARVQNPIGFVISHLNALANFFSATPVNAFAVSFSVLLALAFVIFISFNKKLESLTLRSIFIRNRLRESFIPPNKTLFNHWFSLHENSPAIIGGR